MDKHSKPVPIPDAKWKDGQKLGQYAAGAWTLLRYILLFIRKYTDVSSGNYKQDLVQDAAYTLLLELLGLVDKLMSPRVRRIDIPEIVSFTYFSSLFLLGKANRKIL